MNNIDTYKTIIFDCDGVILDSNDIKSQAFYELALPYGKKEAELLVGYHKKNGGVSRHRKIEYFFEYILKYPNNKTRVVETVDLFGRLVSDKLLTCPMTAFCEDFLNRLMPDATKIIISGGLESELNFVFRKRGLDGYFKGIFGSPRSKEEILNALKIKKELILPAVYFGDSRYDYEMAKLFNMDFVFMSDYSEFDGSRELSGLPGVRIIRNFKDVISGMVMNNR